MEAGREMDALVAEKVMGWRDCYVSHKGSSLQGKPPRRTQRQRVPHYSTEIAAAWLVFIRITDGLFSRRRRFYQALQEQTKRDTADIGESFLITWPDVLTVLRDRMPEAICRAALAAVEAVSSKE